MSGTFLTVVEPFAWTVEGAPAPVEPRTLNRARVTQCALARICGVCAESLGRPVAFVGDADEVARNAFHGPPLHQACADRLAGVFGAEWSVTLTSGFEFVRPAREDLDRQVRFVPNSLLG